MSHTHTRVCRPSGSYIWQKTVYSVTFLGTCRYATWKGRNTDSGSVCQNVIHVTTRCGVLWRFFKSIRAKVCNYIVSCMLINWSITIFKVHMTGRLIEFSMCELKHMGVQTSMRIFQRYMYQKRHLQIKFTNIYATYHYWRQNSSRDRQRGRPPAWLWQSRKIDGLLKIVNNLKRKTNPCFSTVRHVPRRSSTFVWPTNQNAHIHSPHRYKGKSVHIAWEGYTYIDDQMEWTVFICVRQCIVLSVVTTLLCW